MYMRKKLCFAGGIRILAVLLSLVLLSGMIAGCAGDAYRGIPDEDTLSVVTTIFPPYDFALALTEGVSDTAVTQLLRPGMESHTYDPTPADILTVQTCDIFIYTGGESDQWVETLLSSSENDSMQIIRMIELCETVTEEDVEGMTTHGHTHTHNEHEGDEAELCTEDHDSDHIEYDEHVWTSPKNASRICEGITAALIRADGDREEAYTANLTAYRQKLAELDAILQGITENAPLSTLVFGDRFPMRYFCDAYGLSYRAAFPGCAAESEPGAATMVYLIEKLRGEGIPAVFTIEMSNGKIARALSEETGTQILSMHSCHNRTAEEAEAGVTYLDLMYRNAEALRVALYP